MSGLKSEMIKRKVRVWNLTCCFLGCLCHDYECRVLLLLLWGGKIFRAPVGIFKKAPAKKQRGGGRRERERLWLLDLFLWLHHVVVEGSKGDSLFFFFFIQSLDRQKTPVSRGQSSLKTEKKKVKVEVKYDGGPCLFNAEDILQQHGEDDRMYFGSDNAR